MDYFKHLASTTPNPVHMHIGHADGAYVYDIHGKQYLDMIAGISVSNLGHHNQEILAAMNTQMEKFLHATMMRYIQLVVHFQEYY